jgi:hypothetical protein
MKAQYIFPVLLMVLDVGAAVMCFSGGDWKKGIYWIAAAILSATVTF